MRAIVDVTPLPHNGCRPQEASRIIRFLALRLPNTTYNCVRCLGRWYSNSYHDHHIFNDPLKQGSSMRIRWRGFELPTREKDEESSNVLW